MKSRIVAFALVVFLQACSSQPYIPMEYPLRGGAIPALDYRGSVKFVNGQPSTGSVDVTGGKDVSYESNYNDITDIMVRQAAHELSRNGVVKAGEGRKVVVLKVTALHSEYASFFWKSTMTFEASLGDGQHLTMSVTHSSGTNVFQDLNGCIGEGVAVLLTDDRVKAYLAS